MVGTLMLRLPSATHAQFLPLEDALFTATSAVTVTGLIVCDTPVDFTRFGQIVILVLIQLGGLGFMSFSTLIILLFGRPLSLTDRSLIISDFTTGSARNIRSIVIRIFLFTITFETVGAVVLYFQFSHLEGSRRLFSAVFHAVSAFCNAGFSLFSNSLRDFTASPGINLTFIVLILAGGIGFVVLKDIAGCLSFRNRVVCRISLHSKVVLTVSGLLVLAGFLVIWLEELSNPTKSLAGGSRLLASLFQSITARTAGFNTIEMNILSPASLFMIMILMFIGASPGSTGGGVKTTSVGMVFAYIRSLLRGRDRVSLHYRRISGKNIEKALLVIVLSLGVVVISFLLLASFQPGLPFQDLLFETISAFGTVGLSLGVTPQMSLPSKIVIMITMLIGRVGPLTLLIALSRKESRAEFQYPEESIMIG
ncbi:MAG: TrkH family potassium uptake protein [Acidobacteriota bacterium]|nr:TrkH family potassium uptake protein [Acidobacteriota bacterium]